jgi:SAM-dependent methyltransferase
VSSFDRYARDDTYGRVLDESLRVSGEGHAFFAEERVRWLAALLAAEGRPALPHRRTLDFGCGIGATAPLLQQALGGDVVGVDADAASIERARAEHAREGQGGGIRFAQRAALADQAPFDVAYCNGVFHHIPPAERAAELAAVFAALQPGGLFALWENNPANPGTRYIMARCPFDDDAVLLWPRETRRRLAAAGFVVVRTAYRFFFPATLRALRPLEPALVRVPFGAQYVVVGRKPKTR